VPVVFSTCMDLIRTLPVMQHDKDNPEDMDTDSEDHGVDDACLSRPWVPPKAEGAPPPATAIHHTSRLLRDAGTHATAAGGSDSCCGGGP
jgi:hypothetical protein